MIHTLSAKRSLALGALFIVALTALPAQGSNLNEAVLGGIAEYQARYRYRENLGLHIQYWYQQAQAYTGTALLTGMNMEEVYADDRHIGGGDLGFALSGMRLAPELFLSAALNSNFIALPVSLRGLDGEYLPWFLLADAHQGLQWADIMLLEVSAAIGLDPDRPEGVLVDLWPSIVDPGSFGVFSARLEVFSLNRLYRTLSGSELPRIYGVFDPDKTGVTLTGSVDSEYRILDAGTIVNTGFGYLPLLALRRSTFLDEIFLRVMAEVPGSLGWYVRPVLETEFTLLNPGVSKAKLSLDMWLVIDYVLAGGKFSAAKKHSPTSGLTTRLQEREFSYSMIFGPSVSWYGMSSGGYGNLNPIDSTDFFRAYGLMPGINVSYAMFANTNGTIWGVAIAMDVSANDLGIVGSSTGTFFLVL